MWLSKFYVLKVMDHEERLIDISFYLFQNRAQARLLITRGPNKQRALSFGRHHSFIHSFIVHIFCSINKWTPFRWHNNILWAFRTYLEAASSAWEPVRKKPIQPTGKTRKASCCLNLGRPWWFILMQQAMESKRGMGGTEKKEGKEVWWLCLSRSLLSALM